MTHEETRKRREAAIEALVLCYRRDQEEIAKRLVSEVLRWATVQLSQGTSGKRRILDPEDLTQEVVCEVLKSLPRFDSSEGAFMAYAWKIIQRRAHTVLNRASRDTQRRAVDPATGALDALAASTRTVITRLAESEEHRAFERAVASLT
ncbi:MAG: sigma-70 family RNA polymerase sigma factor, partial [bacterium]|nr:sigma-70 family RNA polymerase sigma factor [bacterium]